MPLEIALRHYFLANFTTRFLSKTCAAGMAHEAGRDNRWSRHLHFGSGLHRSAGQRLLDTRDLVYSFARSIRLALAVVLFGFLLAGCSDSSDNVVKGASDETTHAEAVASLVALLPADARGIFAVDLAALLSGGSSEEVTALLQGEGGDPIFDEQFAAIGALAGTIDVTGEMSSALLAQTTDNTDGVFLMAKLRSDTLAEAVVGSMPQSAGTHGPASRALYVDGNGNYLTLLPEGILVVGEKSAVESVVDVADGTQPAGESDIVPFLDALDSATHISFLYGLRALFEDVDPDGTLRSAAVMSGAFDVVDGDIVGSMAFHTANASQFVEDYNFLNRHAVSGEDPTDDPLAVAEPVAQDLDRILVPLPPSPIDASVEDTVAVRNIAKKLLVGMEAHDYAEGVSSTGNMAWIDLIIKSEADGDTPPSPGAVFFRWEFRDQAAMDAFEANELPPGFKLAPTQFLESDDPEGVHCLLLMIYNAGGGSIVDGARAEWDVFVSPPKGADPDAPERPRYMIIQALSEKVSFDPVTLLSGANPLSYKFDGDNVVASIGERQGGSEVTVFESSFPKPDPNTSPVMRWTAEMAIANDYMHWTNGVYDEIVYNATTFNWEGYFVDTAQARITDNSHWAQYIKPTLKDATYYVNTLEYVASPLANLDSEFLDVTDEERQDLLDFKDNGHQRGIMHRDVEEMFLGQGDAYVGIRIANETPSTFYNFEITDSEGLAATLDLPPGYSLAPTSFFESGAEDYYLTLSVYEVEGAIEGMRAQWSVYVDDGSGRPHQLVLELMTADVGLDPVSIFNVPSEVRHELAGDVLGTRLSSAAITFDASLNVAATTDEALTMDWVESGDNICYANGICDKFYYNAETLDVPVQRAADVTVNEFSTPWSAFVSATPGIVFYRDNAQQYAVKRWHNLKVEVEVAPVGGLEDPTHTISGSGKLVGRENNFADSAYIYTGDARVEGNQLMFLLDQQVTNVLGNSHIYTTGSFDLTTGEGTQTVIDCAGPALMCSNIIPGSVAPYTAQGLNATNPDAITWNVNVEVDLTNFGTADSASTFVATRTD